MVRILKNVPLDNTYRNTLFFTSTGNQSAYFSSKSKYTLTNYSYVRPQNAVKVGINSENLYDCNYIMFQNTAFGNKWFYAFITSVEYINNDASLITYEIDVMQTWHFDYSLNMCFVEREMSLNDTIGDNLVPEGLELGTYVYNDQGFISEFEPNQIIVAATFDETMNDATGGLYGGVYSALKYNRFLTWQDANAFIETATASVKSSGIVSVFMYPLAFFSNSNATDPVTITKSRDKMYTDINGYVPKNKKLFTSPYNFLYVTNNEGVAGNFPYEFFSSSTCEFDVTGVVSCSPEFSLVPKNYKGATKNYNEQMTLGNYPLCAYAIDSYRAYLAQNANKLNLAAVSAVTQTASGALSFAITKGAVGANEVLGGIKDISNILANNADMDALPPQAHGQHSPTVNFVNKIKGFQFYNVQIRAEFAQIIDDYFNVYGYATRRVKIPNRSSRPHWNYVKTINASLTGSVPADDMSRIVSVYDKGVTFWKNGSEVGNYALDNRP
jgi:hypothetical protein